MQLKRHSLYMGSTSDAETNQPDSGLYSFKSYFDKVQAQLQELFAEGMLSKAGFLGKSKGALLDIAPVLHVMDHFLRFPVVEPDDERYNLEKQSPPLLIKKEMVDAAVSIVQMCVEQLIVYSPEYAPLAFTTVFQHLQSAAAGAGHKASCSSGSSASAYTVSDEQMKSFKKLLKGKHVVDKIEVSVPYLTSKSVFTNAATTLSAFEVVTSGAGGLPKLGSVKEKEENRKKVKVFVKELPTSAAGFEQLAAKLKAVGMVLSEYLPADKVSALCKQHKIELAGYEDAASSQEDSTT